MLNLKDYNSFEEFIFVNKRYPDVVESKQLYDVLWNKYISRLNDNEKEIAIFHDKLQDYTDGKTHDQKEIVERISKSTGKLKKILSDRKNVISLCYGERWGIYSIYVVVTSLSRRALYKFRADIPNFFEGWEVKLRRASLVQKLIKLIKNSRQALGRPRS